MKYLIIILLGLTLNTSAQQYAHFLNNTDWYQSANDFGFPYYTWYHTSKDTSINNLTYKIITNSDSNDWPSTFFVREDTSQKIVYMIHPANDTLEVMLYNFGLSIGQTTINWRDQRTYTLTKIDTINTAVGLRRRHTFFRYGIMNSSCGYWAIEGIGSPEHPFWLTMCGGDPVYNLYCTFENGVHVYSFMNMTCAFDSVFTNIKSISTELKKDIAIRYTESSIILQPNSAFKISRLILINQLGQIITESAINLQLEFELERNSLAKGVFSYLLMSSDKIVKTGRIVN